MKSSFETQTFTYGRGRQFLDSGWSRKLVFHRISSLRGKFSKWGGGSRRYKSTSARGGSFDLQAVEGQIVGVTLSLRARPLDLIIKEEMMSSCLRDLTILVALSCQRMAEIGLGWDSPPNNLFNFDWQIDDRPSHPAEGYEITLDLATFRQRKVLDYLF